MYQGDNEEIEISDLRNDGSIDICYIEVHTTGKKYQRYLNLPKEKIQEILEISVQSGNHTKEYAKENKSLMKSFLEMY